MYIYIYIYISTNKWFLGAMLLGAPPIALTVDFRNFIVFFGPRPWHIEIRHRVKKKTSTINLFGFKTLKLKIRRLKLWKPTVGWVRRARRARVYYYIIPYDYYYCYCYYYYYYYYYYYTIHIGEVVYKQSMYRYILHNNSSC